MTMHSTSDTWREQNGVITFSVTSNGRTGEEWIIYFDANGIKLTRWAKDALRSSAFQPTNGITMNIAILKGELFTDENRVTSFIQAEADKRKLTKPNAEVACLIRDMFTNQEIKEMGLKWIVAMHEPIEDSDRNPNFLGTGRLGDGPWLSTDFVKPGHGWSRVNGFVFAAP